MEKIETIEEVAEKLSKNAYKKHSVEDDKLSLDEQIQRSGGFIVGFKEGMIEGAKLQQKNGLNNLKINNNGKNNNRKCNRLKKVLR